MKNAVIIGCNNKYVPKAIIALTQFTEYNIDYKKFIIGTTFTETMKLLCIAFYSVTAFYLFCCIRT